MLYQQRLSEQVFWPTIGILIVGAAILAWNPAGLAAYRSYLIVMMASSGSILVFTLLLRLMAFVQCDARGLHVRSPLYRLTIPYDQIRATRPTELYRLFPPKKQRWTERRFLDPLFGRTVVIVELDQLPRPRFWLRFWLGKYVLCPDAVGLVLPVRDWMSFRTELDEFRYRYRHA
jgi:hypothetical protein